MLRLEKYRYFFIRNSTYIYLVEVYQQENYCNGRVLAHLKNDGIVIAFSLDQIPDTVYQVFLEKLKFHGIPTSKLEEIWSLYTKAISDFMALYMKIFELHRKVEIEVKKLKMKLQPIEILRKLGCKLKLSFTSEVRKCFEDLSRRNICVLDIEDHDVVLLYFNRELKVYIDGHYQPITIKCDGIKECYDKLIEEIGNFLLTVVR